MKQNVEKMIGCKMGAVDGEIGEVKTFYFDDKSWTVRYLVVETGSWLFSRKVLIAPKALLQPDWENKVLPVDLTKKQVEDSPNVDAEKPVSMQQELELYKHYNWGNYWGGMGTSGMMMPVAEPFDMAIKSELENDKKPDDNNPNLRSTGQVKGYNVETTDGTVGEIESFIIDDQSWEIKFIIVDAGGWFNGKKVLISPEWIKEIDWAMSKVVVNATEAQVKNSPVYDPNMPLQDTYSISLFDYYGRKISH